jgi:outer membrane protein OmpA-like peptidoglycan-associated protein
MKKLVVLFAMLFSVLAIQAQYTSVNQYPGDQKAEKEYQTAVDKQNTPAVSALRTSWLASRPASNWFVSLEGGLTYVGAENFSKIDVIDNLFPTGGLVAGKWFSPVWGLRFSIGGAALKGYSPNAGGTWFVGTYNGPSGEYTPFMIADNEVLRGFVRERFLNTDEPYKTGYRYDYSYGTAGIDFLLNLKNFFRPYRPTTVFNPVLYAGLGYARTFKDDDRPAVNSIAEKMGIQFNFALSKRLDIYLATEALLVPEFFDRYLDGDLRQDILLNAKLGLTYHFAFTGFLKADLVDQQQLDALNDQINQLRNRPEVICPPVVISEPEVVSKEVVKPVELTPVFFTIGSSVVRDNQLLSIAKAAQYLLDNPSAQLEIAAYADRKTGSAAVNLKISENRANAVSKLLTQKFGIEKKRLKTSFYGDKVQPFAENDQNRVAIFIR